MLMLKAITPEVHPQPNHSRHEWAPWDAYINTEDPDALYAEFTGRQVPMRRGWPTPTMEVIDNNGCVALWAAAGEVAPAL